MLNAKELIASLQSSLNSPLESNHPPSAKYTDTTGSSSKANSGSKPESNGTNTKNGLDKRSGVAQMLSGGVWGGLEGGGVGSNLQQFVLIGECE